MGKINSFEVEYNETAHKFAEAGLRDEMLTFDEFVEMKRCDTWCRAQKEKNGVYGEGKPLTLKAAMKTWRESEEFRKLLKKGKKYVDCVEMMKRYFNTNHMLERNIDELGAELLKYCASVLEKIEDSKERSMHYQTIIAFLKYVNYKQEMQLRQPILRGELNILLNRHSIDFKRKIERYLD